MRPIPLRALFCALVALALAWPPEALAVRSLDAMVWELPSSSSRPERLAVVRKAGRALESFATVGAGEDLAPWLGTGVHWQPAPGLQLSVEGRALLPDPMVDEQSGSGLMGGVTLDITGW